MTGWPFVKIAQFFLKQQLYHRFFLEWDDDRAGSLGAVSVFLDRPNVKIVFDLLLSRTNTLDDEGACSGF
jgi:hypothetical protein